MNPRHLTWLLLIALAGCGGGARRPEPVRVPQPATSGPAVPSVPAGEPGKPPADVMSIPDAVPRVEPRSARGNPAFYDVMGKRYFVLATPKGYKERGVASWYGPTFHEKDTSNGESYDMYAMTAAHKTLPLPCYARVTNLANGRSIVVRINDRGPFVGNRIIDLSYTAAHKLDMVRAGTAFVEVEVLTPGTLADSATTLNAATATAAVPAPTLTGPTLYLQAGAFGVQDNAAGLATRLRSAGIASAIVRNPAPGSSLYRVRVGPIANVADFDRLVAQMAAMGIDARLAAEF